MLFNLIIEGDKMKCQVKKLLCRFSFFHLFLFSHPKYNINFFTKSSHPQARKKKNGVINEI